MNRYFVTAFLLIGLIALAVEVGHPVNAVSKIIVVPDDYPTIAAAIGNATDGDTVIVKSGTYTGALTINKSITLTGEESKITILDLPSPYDPSQYSPALITTSVIRVNADGVKISNFTINNYNPNGGYGVATIGNGVKLESNTINTGLNISGQYNSISQNTISNSVHYFNGPFCNITDNTFINNSISISGNYLNLLHNSFTNNALYLYINSSTLSNNNLTGGGLGMGFSNCYLNLVRENNVEFFRNAIELLNSSNNVFTGNYIANNVKNPTNPSAKNGFGIEFNGQTTTWGEFIASKNNTFYLNTFINNTCNVKFNEENPGKNFTTFLNFWDNGTFGNYWDDYLTKYPNATMIGLTGIGDAPYVLNENNKDNFPLMAPFNLENNTIRLPSPMPSPSVPEFPTWIILVVTMMATLIAIKFRKRGDLILS